MVSSKLTCHITSTDDRVNTISTGSFSPGCGSDVGGRYLPLTDDFTVFFGERFNTKRAGCLLTASVMVFRCREAAVTRSLELLVVPLLTAMLERDVLLSLADAPLSLMHRSLPLDGNLHRSYKWSMHKILTKYGCRLQFKRSNYHLPTKHSNLFHRCQYQHVLAFLIQLLHTVNSEIP